MAKTTSGTWPTVSRQQLAELIGVHPDTVTDYARAGMPVITRGGRGKESAYDAVVCLGWWRENNGQNAKEAAQTRQYEALAELNELKLSIQRDELVPMTQVVLEGRSYTEAWKAKVRAMSRRLIRSGAIRAEQEPAVTAYCDDLLRDIAGWKIPADTKRAIRQANAA